MKNKTTPIRVDDQSGFSLVEIVVAMFLIGIVAMIVLPIFVNTTGISMNQPIISDAQDTTTSVLEDVKYGGGTPSCYSLQESIDEHNDDNLHSFVSHTGVQENYTLTLSSDSCSQVNSPQSVTVDAEARASEDNSVLFETTTKVFVQ